MSDSVTSSTAARQASLSFTVSWSLLRIMSIKSVMLSNHLILCCYLLLMLSIFPRIRIFSNERKWLFISSGQSTGASASASVLSMNIQGRFPVELTGWISLQSKGLSRVFFNHNSKASVLQHSAFFMPNSHICT